MSKILPFYCLWIRFQNWQRNIPQESGCKHEAVFEVYSLLCQFWTLINKQWRGHIFRICHWMSTNEVSKCAKINSTSFDNLYFPCEVVIFETLVLKATFRKLYLSCLDIGVSDLLCCSITFWKCICKSYYVYRATNGYFNYIYKTLFGGPPGGHKYTTEKSSG